jgi:capsule polysaccharide export protein KpsE/RkpR
MGSLPRLLIFCAISLCSYARGNEPYPIVDRSAQAARDIDRRAILEAELATEQTELRNAQEAIAKAPSEEARKEVHRHEENIKALRRELDRVTSPIRLTGRAATEDTNVDKRTASKPAGAPFWDVYRRIAPPTDFQPPAKESP